MLVAITVVLAALTVLVAIVVVAIGGGGELSVEHPDHPPLALPGRRAVGGTDAALLRLPLGLWGYHKQITDEALERFAHELTERDTRIAVLEQELAEARGTTSPQRALSPARDPHDAFATRVEQDPSPRALPAIPDDPRAPRAEVIGDAPAADPWKTIADRHDGENETGDDGRTAPKDEAE